MREPGSVPMLFEISKAMLNVDYGLRRKTVEEFIPFCLTFKPKNQAPGGPIDSGNDPRVLLSEILRFILRVLALTGTGEGLGKTALKEHVPGTVVENALWVLR